MKKLILVSIIALTLGGCMQTFQPTVTHIESVVPPDNLYQCPNPKKPNSEGLRDSAVSKYLIRLYTARAQCAASLDNIKRYTNDAVRVQSPLQR
jgi:hypothetical protein